jgi:hypothetical protein
MGREDLLRRAAEIEIHWRQSERDGWVAVLIERKTKRQWEVRSKTELEGVLAAIVADRRRPPITAPLRRRTALTGLLGGEGETEPRGRPGPPRDGADGSDGSKR